MAHPCHKAESCAPLLSAMVELGISMVYSVPCNGKEGARRTRLKTAGRQPAVTTPAAGPWRSQAMRRRGRDALRPAGPGLAS